MITGDHLTTARVIANQVNIFSSVIARHNGIDTFASEVKEIINLYRADQLIEKHEVLTVTKLNLNISTVANQEEIPPWYKRMFKSCRNRFTDPVSKKLDEESIRMNYIPYGVIVSGSEIGLRGVPKL